MSWHRVLLDRPCPLEIWRFDHAVPLLDRECHDLGEVCVARLEEVVLVCRSATRLNVRIFAVLTQNTALLLTQILSSKLSCKKCSFLPNSFLMIFNI